MKNILFVFGTRPEAIKLAPLVIEFKKDKQLVIKVCITAQHRELLDPVLNFFQIIPDYDLNLMQPNQGLMNFMANALTSLENVFNKFNPDLVFVQGDTTTVLAGSLVAFHKKVRIAHVEAGLRSHNKHSPFPEEINRVITSQLADIHFAPTTKAVENLKQEGITDHVYLTGNTVIDALKIGIANTENKEREYSAYFEQINFSKKVILITCHRRESFGEPFKNICDALLEIARTNPGFELVYPVHLNPNINDVANKLLLAENIKLIPPLEYPQLIWLMNKSFLILTDSGGIQEEAPTLGKPVLVLRDVTERTEGIDAGTAKLVGTGKENIVKETLRLINDRRAYLEMSNAVNPYGDGSASMQILKIIKNISSLEAGELKSRK